MSLKKRDSKFCAFTMTMALLPDFLKTLEQIFFLALTDWLSQPRGLLVFSPLVGGIFIRHFVAKIRLIKNGVLKVNVALFLKAFPVF